jgi:hypothetical protein
MLPATMPDLQLEREHLAKAEQDIAKGDRRGAEGYEQVNRFSQQA